MALLHMPFAQTGVDTTLHVVAAVVLLGAIIALVYFFWRFHELPVHEAEKRNHPQLALVATLTWVEFFWHWVWVIAIIIAYVDGEQLVRDTWRGK